MIVPYLSDVAIYCKQAVFFSSLSGSSMESRPSCSPFTSACIHPLCCEFTLPCSKELQGFELQPQLKDDALAVACDFENSNLFFFWREQWQDRERELSCSQFCFSVRNQKTLLALLAPKQHATALVVDCRGVNYTLFLYGVAHLSQLNKIYVLYIFQKERKAPLGTQPQFIFTNWCFIFIWYQIFAKHLPSCDFGKPLYSISCEWYTLHNIHSMTCVTLHMDPSSIKL